MHLMNHGPATAFTFSSNPLGILSEGDASYTIYCTGGVVDHITKHQLKFDGPEDDMGHLETTALTTKDEWYEDDLPARVAEIIADAESNGNFSTTASRKGSPA